jgi:DedD protein
LRATSPASHSTSTVAPDPAPPDASTGNVSKSLTPKFSANENPTRKVPSISDRKESARALAILEGANLDSAASAKTPKGIVIQVGAFATQEKVNELRGKLTSAGIKSFTQKIATSSGNKIRVRIGPFSDKESAEKANANLAKLGFNGTLVAL